MKKTVSVNLNGQVFSIDEDAYGKLNEYLQNIEQHFANENERKEIIADIEARIAELLQDKVTEYKQVINIADVESVIEVMGNPNDFAGEENENQEQNQNQQYDQYVNYKRYRRMYRDSDNRVIGGVCSGLGAYWAFDPSILRVIFVVLAIFGGSGLVIYLILWIVLPEAKTTVQKLEMRGEPVNVSNIGNFVKEEFEHVKNQFKRKKK
jgi:phage shock protein PspC (stress-responsive transcriptional regulator)